MNERISQLISQAQEEVWGNNPYNGSPEFEGYKLNPEKFAELIVRECANHCDLLLDHKISSEWSRGTHDCSRAIKQHFEVNNVVEKTI